MVARVTATEVREIITTSLTDANIDAFIASATLVVDRYSAECSEADAATLFEIERQLTAHMLSASDVDQRLSSRKFGDSSQNYFTQSGLNLDSSQYGQNVKMLDPCGILADYGKRRGFVRLV